MDDGQISMKWEEGRVSRYEIQAGNAPLSLTLVYNGIREEIQIGAGEQFLKEICGNKKDSDYVDSDKGYLEKETAGAERESEETR